MKVFHTVEEVRKYVNKKRKNGKTIALVPTMGYLHEGHESLVKRAAKENDIVVASVFVNPIQFGPNEDFESYPRDFERDCKVLEKAGASAVFNPTAEKMYGENFTTYVNTTGVTENLCGKSRPVHFKGVCTVVLKLFNIVTPDRAYFGQKDAQQLSVIRRMVRDLNVPVEIVGCPIIREKDGLAKSSRNTYLSEEERKAALVLSQAVKLGQELVAEGEKDTTKIVSKMKELIEKEPLAKIDYVEAVDLDTVENVLSISDGKKVLFAEAVYIGKTRLIDNFITE